MPLTLVGFVGLVFDLLNLASGAAPLGCAPRAPDSEAHQRPRAGRHGAFYGLLSLRPSISGSLAKFAANRRASLGEQTGSPAEAGVGGVAVAARGQPIAADRERVVCHRR